MFGYKRHRLWQFALPVFCLVFFITGCNATQPYEMSTKHADEGKAQMIDIADAKLGGREPISQTTVFVCNQNVDPFELVLHEETERASLWLPSWLGGPYLVINQLSGNDSRQYTGDDVAIRILDSGIIFEASGETFTCSRDDKASIEEHAKLKGVSFRAVGNEPGWSLEIRPDLETAVGQRSQFLYDYGERQTVLVALTEESDSEKGTVIWTGQSSDDLPFSIILEGSLCSDTMSGEMFPTIVTVKLGSTVYRGCGRPLH